MAHNDFIPARTDEFMVWHDQFKTATTTIGGTLGVTPAELTAIGNDNTDLHTKVNASTTAAAAALQATKNLTDSRSTAEKNVRNLARRIKTNAAYTPALGKQLGVDGPEDTTDMTAAKPKLTAKAQPHGVVELQFVKSKSDGVNIYSQRDGDAGFVFLARDTASPYVDNRALLTANKPEVRKFKAIYVLNDAETGQASDEVTVTVQP